MYVYTHTHTYTRTHIERERERKRERNTYIHDTIYTLFALHLHILCVCLKGSREEKKNKKTEMLAKVRSGVSDVIVEGLVTS